VFYALHVPIPLFITTSVSLRLFRKRQFVVFDRAFKWFESELKLIQNGKFYRTDHPGFPSKTLQVHIGSVLGEGT